MPVYDIDGVPVSFPYHAYDCQLVYMRAVVEALGKGSNALLESPTGTGKTLCLLCSVLGWAEQQRKLHGNAPRIYYTSRTHAQLKQVVKEFRRTEYSEVEMAVLGSRQQLCIHPRAEETSAAVKNAVCATLRPKRKCRWYNELEGFIEKGGLASVRADDSGGKKGEKRRKGDDGGGEGPTRTYLEDIEDLVQAGRTHTFCPFYYSRRMAATADIVFCPYNYIIDPAIRASLQIDLHQTIIITDEAHNIASNTMESASYHVSLAHLSQAQTECHRARASLLDVGENDDPDSNARKMKDYDLLHLLFSRFSNALEARYKQGPVEDGQVVFDPKGVLALLATDLSLDSTSIGSLNKVIDSAISDIAVEAMVLGTKPDTPGLDRVRGLLAMLFGGVPHEVLSEGYRAVLKMEEMSPTRRKGNEVLTLTLLCMDASVPMSELMGLRSESAPRPLSLLITSGTMHPLDIFGSELGLPFPVKLQNKHVIDRDQTLVLSVPKGPRGVALDSRYQNRQSDQYVKELGLAVLNIARLVPKGLLVFFPSFSFMGMVLEKWKEHGSYSNGQSLYDAIYAVKMPVTEPSGGMKLMQTVREYVTIIGEGRAAVLFGVCRAKLSEGIDFPDDYARGVVIIGVPYANPRDIRVSLRMKYIDSAGKAGFTGRDWYNTDAIRSVNQAIGRVIRHRYDYGAIYLLDERYSAAHLTRQLPTWIAENLKIPQSFVDVTQPTSAFFKHNEVKHTGVQLQAKAAPFSFDVEPEAPPAPLEDAASVRSAFQVARVGLAAQQMQTAPETAASFVSSLTEKTRVASLGLQGSEKPIRPLVRKRAHVEVAKAEVGEQQVSTPATQPSADQVKRLALSVGKKVERKKPKVEGKAKEGPSPDSSLVEFRRVAREALPGETYEEWKGILKELITATSTGKGEECLRDRLLPFLFSAVGRDSELITSHHLVLPPPLIEPYKRLVRPHA